MIEESGSGSIPLTSGSGSGRPKNMWIRIWFWIQIRFWIRIRNTAGKAKVCQSGGMPVWQGQGSSVRRNVSQARPRFVTQEECQSGKAKVRQWGGMPVRQGQDSSIGMNAGLLMSRGTFFVEFLKNFFFWALLVSLFVPSETFVFYNLVDDILIFIQLITLLSFVSDNFLKS